METRQGRSRPILVVLVVAAVSLCTPAVVLSVAAAVLQGQVSTPAEAEALSRSAWLVGNRVILLVLVMVPVVLCALLLALASYTLHKLRSGKHDSSYRWAALRMVLVLSAMLLCVATRCAILWYDFFVGAPFSIKYYVAYMVAEALPLVPMLVLVTLAFYSRRRTSVGDAPQMKSAATESVPLLAGNEDNQQYDY